MSDAVLTEVRGNVLIVTLNRPEAKNAAIARFSKPAEAPAPAPEAAPAPEDGEQTLAEQILNRLKKLNIV